MNNRILSPDCHLIDDMLSSRISVDQPKHITDIHVDGTLKVRIENHVASHRLDVTVERKSDELSFTIQHRRTRVTTCNIVISQEVHRHKASFVSILTKIFLRIQVEKPLWKIELRIVLLILLHHSVECRIVVDF